MPSKRGQRRFTNEESAERRRRDRGKPEARSSFAARAKQPVDGRAFRQAVQNERGEQSYAEPVVMIPMQDVLVAEMLVAGNQRDTVRERVQPERQNRHADDNRHGRATCGGTLQPAFGEHGTEHPERRDGKRRPACLCHTFGEDSSTTSARIAATNATCSATTSARAPTAAR